MQAEEILEATYARHGRAALMFSGGKDSLAVLELARPYWSRTAVVWVDTGATLPEVHEMMDRFKNELPYFFVVNTDQPGHVAEHGHPVDVLPVFNTAFGQQCTGKPGLKLQSALDCCRANVWEPSYRFIQTLGVTALLRGVRGDEAISGPTRSGEVHDGMELVYPIQDWTRDDVLEFLAGRGYDEERFQLGHSSLDCWSCTAFTSEVDRLAYLKKHHPNEAKKVFATLAQIKVVVQKEADELSKTLEAVNGV